MGVQTPDQPCTVEVQANERINMNTYQVFTDLDAVERHIVRRGGLSSLTLDQQDNVWSEAERIANKPVIGVISGRVGLTFHDPECRDTHCGGTCLPR